LHDEQILAQKPSRGLAKSGDSAQNPGQWVHECNGDFSPTESRKLNLRVIDFALHRPETGREDTSTFTWKNGAVALNPFSVLPVVPATSIVPDAALWRPQTRGGC
jgi:hypothetical protein